MWRFFILLSLYLASSALPLATGVGRNLEYEYALLASWYALLLVPLYGLLIPARYLPVADSDYEIDGSQQIFWIFLISPAIALVPPILLFALKICPCSRTGFVFWMTYLWYPAWILSHALMHGLMAARIHGVRRVFAASGFILLLVGAAALAAWALWSEPQKRYIGLFTGFLHGPVYDELIFMDHGLVLGRAAHLLTATALLTLAWWHVRTYGLMVVTVILASLALTLGTLSTRYPSMASTKQALDRELAGKMIGPGFTLHFSKAAATSAVDPSILRLYRDSEFHIQELTTVLKDGDALPHVDIYAYQNEEQKKLWFGGGATDVTDVKTPSVHITMGSWPHPTLRHELVHALASGFGFHGLGFHPNMAFTEGLAVALAPEGRTMSLDDGAAALLESNRLPPIEDLFSPKFWRISGARAYTVAGSFIRFLIDTKGIKGVKALYSGKSWQDAFGASRNSFVQLWKDKITSSYDKNQNSLYAEALFRAQGLFGDVCPHTKRDLDQNRDESFYIRVRQPLGWDPAQEFLPWLTNLDPKNQEAKIRLWKKEIKSLGAERFPDAQKLEEWRDTLAKAWRQQPESIEDIEVGILLSDVLRLQGKTAESIQSLLAIQETGTKRYIGDQIIREVEARIRLEQLGDPMALEWRRVIAGFTKTLPDQTKEPSDIWLLTYLRFRNGKDDQFSKEQLSQLLTQVPPDLALPRTFAFEWYKLIAGRAMKVEDYPLAKRAYEHAAGTAQIASRELFMEHARRAQYFAEKGPLGREKPATAGH